MSRSDDKPAPTLQRFEEMISQDIFLLFGLWENVDTLLRTCPAFVAYPKPI
jgi:hypothetical protein